MSIEKTFRELIQANKLEDAKRVLKDLIESGVPEKDRGKVLAEALYAYVKTSNDASDVYGAHLEEMIAMLKEADLLSKEVEEEMKLDTLRGELGEA